MHRYQKILLLVLIVSGLIPRALLLSSDANTIISVVFDDAFYYFKTAQNIVFHHSSTFDQINPTNGYQPLWMGLLLPVVAVIKDPWVLVKFVVSFNILLDLFTAIFIYRTLKKLTRLWCIPCIGAAVYYFNPAVVRASVNGMETTIASLLFTAMLSLTLLRTEAPSQVKWHRLLLGVLLGLLFLARTDNVFYIIIILLIAIFEEKKRLRLQTAAVLGISVCVVVSPWIIWSFVKFDSFMQVSGVAVPYTLHEKYLAEGHSTFDMLRRSAEIFIRFLTKGIYRTPLGIKPLSFWLCITISTIAVISRWKAPPTTSASISSANSTGADYHQLLRRSIRILLMMGAGAFLLIFVHSFIRWYPRAHYFTQIIVLFALVISFAIAFIDVRSAFGSILYKWNNSKIFSNLGLATLFAACSIWGAVSVNHSLRYGRGRGPYQVDMLRAAYWLRDNLADDEIACGFNVGIIGFFSGHRVVNLDGAINNKAFTAIKNRNLFCYMDLVSAKYYVDWEPEMLDRYSTFLGKEKSDLQMTLVHEIHPSEAILKSTVKVYRLD